MHWLAGQQCHTQENWQFSWAGLAVDWPNDFRVSHSSGLASSGSSRVQNGTRHAPHLTEELVQGLYRTAIVLDFGLPPLTPSPPFSSCSSREFWRLDCNEWQLEILSGLLQPGIHLLSLSACIATGFASLDTGISHPVLVLFCSWTGCISSIKAWTLATNRAARTLGQTHVTDREDTPDLDFATCCSIADKVCRWFAGTRSADLIIRLAIRIVKGIPWHWNLWISLLHSPWVISH